MPYLHGTFTLAMTNGSAPTHGPVLVVPTIRPHAVYPLHIHIRLDGGSALTDGPVAVVPTIRRQALYALHIHTTLDGRFALTNGPGPILPRKLKHAIYPFHIHTSLGASFYTDSWGSTRRANKTATCRLPIAHSHLTWRKMSTFSRAITPSAN